MSDLRRYKCRSCQAMTSGFRLADGPVRCDYCLTPFGTVTSKRVEQVRRAGDPGIGRRRDRKLAREEAALETGDMLASHPGNPLGRGMPLGTSLRYEEESHREAWKRVLRGDVCAYCWRSTLPCAYTPRGGTVDHVDPQSGPRPLYGLHTWMNYTGACSSCNNAKGSQSMLLFMLDRSRGDRFRPRAASSRPATTYQRCP